MTNEGDGLVLDGFKGEWWKVKGCEPAPPNMTRITLSDEDRALITADKADILLFHDGYVQWTLVVKS